MRVDRGVLNKQLPPSIEVRETVFPSVKIRIPSLDCTIDIKDVRVRIHELKNEIAAEELMIQCFVVERIEPSRYMEAQHDKDFVVVCRQVLKDGRLCQVESKLEAHEVRVA